MGYQRRTPRIGMEDERIAMPSRANQRFGPGSGYDLHACFESKRSDRCRGRSGARPKRFAIKFLPEEFAVSTGERDHDDVLPGKRTRLFRHGGHE